MCHVLKDKFILSALNKTFREDLRGEQQEWHEMHKLAGVLMFDHVFLQHSLLTLHKKMFHFVYSGR